jgi:hypothetical protein
MHVLRSLRTVVAWRRNTVYFLTDEVRVSQEELGGNNTCEPGRHQRQRHQQLGRGPRT